MTGLGWVALSGYVALVSVLGFGGVRIGAKLQLLPALLERLLLAVDAAARAHAARSSGRSEASPVVGPHAPQAAPEASGCQVLGGIGGH